MFFAFIKETYPQLYPKFREMYAGRSSNVKKEYFKYIMDMVY
jgi:hypothetical protein